jgi:hypothetical protein
MTETHTRTVWYGPLQQHCGRVATQTFSCSLSTFCNSISIITPLWRMSSICSPFSSQLITSNSSSMPIVFCPHFTWTALDDVDLGLPLTLVTKANAVEGGITSAAWLYLQRKQATHVTNGVAVTSFSASLQHNTSAARDRVRQIAVDRNLSRKFGKWWKFSSRVKAKSRKTRPDCTVTVLILNTVDTDTRQW